MSADILRDLARAKAAFQLRALRTIIDPASAMSTGTAKTPQAVEGRSPASATAESRDAQTPSKEP